MEFILQTYNKDNQKLLADGPVTKSNAILIYSDNKADLKIKIAVDGTKEEVKNALAVHFKMVSLGDKTTGKFKFVLRQTELPIKDPEPGLSEADITEEKLELSDAENTVAVPMEEIED